LSLGFQNNLGICKSRDCGRCVALLSLQVFELTSGAICSFIGSNEVLFSPFLVVSFSLSICFLVSLGLNLGSESKSGRLLLGVSFTGGTIQSTLSFNSPFGSSVEFGLSSDLPGSSGVSGTLGFVTSLISLLLFILGGILCLKSFLL